MIPDDREAAEGHGVHNFYQQVKAPGLRVEVFSVGAFWWQSSKHTRNSASAALDKKLETKQTLSRLRRDISVGMLQEMSESNTQR